jgi:hypothetical protein
MAKRRKTTMVLRTGAPRSTRVRWASDRRSGTPPKVVRQAANGEVGGAVRDHHGDVSRQVQLTSTQRRADPGIASSDDERAEHDYSFGWFCRSGRWIKTCSSQNRNGELN